jgi:hypothetical protein
MLKKYRLKKDTENHLYYLVLKNIQDIIDIQINIGYQLELNPSRGVYLDKFNNVLYSCVPRYILIKDVKNDSKKSTQ